MKSLFKIILAILGILGLSGKASAKKKAEVKKIDKKVKQVKKTRKAVQKKKTAVSKKKAKIEKIMLPIILVENSATKGSRSLATTFVKS